MIERRSSYCGVLGRGGESCGYFVVLFIFLTRVSSVIIVYSFNGKKDGKTFREHHFGVSLMKFEGVTSQQRACNSLLTDRSHKGDTVYKLAIELSEVFL